MVLVMIKDILVYESRQQDSTLSFYRYISYIFPSYSFIDGTLSYKPMKLLALLILEELNRHHCKDQFTPKLTTFLVNIRSDRNQFFHFKGGSSISYLNGKGTKIIGDFSKFGGLDALRDGLEASLSLLCNEGAKAIEEPVSEEEVSVTPGSAAIDSPGSSDSAAGLLVRYHKLLNLTLVRKHGFL